MVANGDVSLKFVFRGVYCLSTPDLSFAPKLLKLPFSVCASKGLDQNLRFKYGPSLDVLKKTLKHVLRIKISFL